MFSFIRESLLDESGKPSAPRTQSFILTCSGVVIALIGIFMVPYVPNITGYVSAVLATCWGKSAVDIWASQLKSAKVNSARTHATVNPPTPAPQTGQAPTSPASSSSEPTDKPTGDTKP